MSLKINLPYIKQISELIIILFRSKISTKNGKIKKSVLTSFKGYKKRFQTASHSWYGYDS